MEKYMGLPVFRIVAGQISDNDRDKYNSFATRIPGPITASGGFQGAISCASSTDGHEECVFVSETVRSDQDQAMNDARNLMYELRAHGEE